MKKIYSFLIITVAAITVSSCNKYLDINSVNPNTATTATPELVLPQAITAVAGQNFAFNLYGAQTVGQLANGGGVSGWGAIISYNYVSTDQTGLFNNSYNTATDIQYVIDQTDGKANYANLNASAKVLKAFVFQRLVDQYNDVPYTEATKGSAFVTPKYDKATDIYKSLADLCDAAVATMTTSPAGTADAVFRTADVMFAGDKLKWQKLAQTIKLRLILRAGSKVTFTNTTFNTTIGFLEDDAIVNPGYAKISGKQNPTWNSFAYTFANAQAAGSTQYVPTPYVLGFFNGDKINDPQRGYLYYKNGTVPVTTPTANKYPTPVNQLGSLLATAGRGQTPNSWFRGTNVTAYDQAGIFKGFDAGQPIFLAADSYFLQAEAVIKGIIPGNAKTLFDNGILASFRYLDKNAAGVVAGNFPGTTTPRNPGSLTGGTGAGAPYQGEIAKYKTDNSTNYLVNFDLATTPAQQLEAIITQKYIALNFLMGDEAWNEYRRTGYPANNFVSGADPIFTFNSIVGESTAPDRLPARLLYPNTEFNYNAANIPTVDKYTSKVFWAR
ncbi:SusD/RagB family nutrient-binding outer membrane lipoprotein [Mucilaginibacter terrae]|uniref:SusD/RagB family nutrient-binding outer membrane lipoprotein n=1 Tax=Mucilaginibacter terrae TaxID=1955052 RepID=UPI0036290C4B